ncbi:MAG: hypothetical protein JNK35_06115 [Phycisphaerae bacterium]|nr:hypothetical protein [Phycisphaerae bacterium]
MIAGSVRWAFFLASSWTWCIGMFLPILLVRDFGPWGFVAFAVPNVLGAAAMGWVINKDRSARLVAAHPSALRAFAAVTIAFQVFFGLWLAAGGDAGPLGPLDDLAAASIRALVAFALIIPALGPPRGLFAPAVWVASAATLVAFLGENGLPAMPAATIRPTAELLPLAGVCTLGFLLSPYLDPTFHRAAQDAPSPRAAFSLGFCALFPAMILGTLLYLPRSLAGDRDISTSVGWLAVAHIGLQLAFTIREHLRAGTALGGSRDPAGVSLRTPALAVGVAAVILFHWVGDGPVPRLGFTVSEAAYRAFMVFYGLFFPAYVLLCVIPPHGRPLAPASHATFRVFAFACGVALPFYWMGFIERQTWWLLPGVAVVLLARPVAVRAAALHSPAARG